MDKSKKTKVIATSAVAVVVVLLSVWLAIPTVAVTPCDGSSEIIPGTPLAIDSSALSSVGKVLVTVDGKPVLTEYNLESGNVSRDLELKPGQEVRVETKVASVIGLTREFVSTYRTVEPVVVNSIEVNGSELSAGQKIPPQPTLRFMFNKPVSNASVTVDGGDSVDLSIDGSDASSATMTPLLSLKQGTMHVFKVRTADTAGVETESQEIRAMVVKPLSLYGKALADGNGVRVELDSSVAFKDPEAVKSVIGTDLPGANISVEHQKIVIISNSISQSQAYTIAVGGTEGEDGSFLEGPLVLTLNYNAGETQVAQADASTGYTYSGYTYTSGSSGQASGGGSSGGDSGPPPGWPPCCPWPPR